VRVDPRGAQVSGELDPVIQTPWTPRSGESNFGRFSSFVKAVPPLESHDARWNGHLGGLPLSDQS